MRSARNLWLGYLGAGLVVVAVVGVISGVALHLEARAERTRQREERLDRVRIALWRLDSYMTPLLGRVAGHAYSHFVPAYAPARLYDAQGRRQRSKLLLEPSPILLNDWPPWVVLHFQAPLTGRITSPQVPEGWYRWVASVPGVRAPRAKAAQVRQLERLLAPAVRRRLVRAVAPDLPHGGHSALALAGRRSGWRRQIVQTPPPVTSQQQAPAQRPVQRRVKHQQRRVPEQKFRQNNWGNSQQQFTPRSNPESLNNALLNTNIIAPAQVNNDANLRKIVVPLSPVRSTWIAGDDPATRRLILYRVARVRGRHFLQGALLDWPRLQKELAGLLTDLFGQVRLRPQLRAGAVASTGSEHAMTTLPVVLELPARAGLRWYRWTPVRGALGVAWVLTLLALFATALVIRRMVELGERRMSFVSAVSHELRTPLTAFRVHLDLLADGMVPDEAKRQDMLEKLRGQSERLTELVRNVLDFARLERRTFVAELQQIEVTALLDELAQSVTDRVALAGVTLEVDNALASTATVRTDLTAVRQIIDNLVDNACKYGADSADPRVHLRARADPGGDALLLEVADHGPGIPAKARRHLFDAFYRAGPEMTREKPGVGLGLALAKRFADTLGARLTLTGAPRDDGTLEAIFTLRLPGLR